MAGMGDWLSFLVDAIGGGAAFICLFEGTRRLAMRLPPPGSRRGSVLMVALGAAYCVLYGGYHLNQSRELRDYSQALYQNPYRAELPPRWGDHLPPDRRAAASMQIARAAFIETGSLRSYIDTFGARRPFAPAQADIRRRDFVVATQTRLEESARASLANGMLWLIWGALAVLFGFGLARQKSATPL
jgi:hypothetical protein